jgi:sulfur-oxidizing protein SoxY
MASKVQVFFLTALILAFSTLVPATAHATPDDDLWQSLRQEVFGTREISENSGVVVIDAPNRAEDAAIVPVTIRIPPTVKGALKSMTLIIDKNPAPVAATFKFGPAHGEGGGERRISTRVRIDSFSYVRGIVETTDGKLHMAKAFVMGAGGCSAPAPKDIDGASADLGKIMIRSFDPALSTTPVREAQIMIRHPNTSGLQIDPVSRGYVPAHFVKDVTVMRGQDLVFKVDAGISISTDPNFRFTFANTADNKLDVTAIDSENAVFTASQKADGS